ncbi:MAG: histidinol-phosphate aminotransferase family protein [Candidatus Bathyarchaeota archaeon]|nr:histidinol-phosphate aminotransferase family protein [Candidatus Termiticorpusculum sp.]
MRSVSSLVKENIKALKPCVHGGEVLDVAAKIGVRCEDILDFSSSVNPLGTSKKALAAVVGAFGSVAAYPDSSSLELRGVIAGHYGVAVDNVIVGNGSTELMYLFAEVFLSRGDIVVMAAPTFGEYERAVRKTGADIHFVKLDSEQRLDVNAFISAMSTGAKMAFICNPNNPTSLLVSPQDLKCILDFALARGVLVFLDEDFLEFVEDDTQPQSQSQSMISCIGKYSNLFVLRSFTKLFGLTGLRVGYGIADKEIIDVLLSVKLPWNVNCLAQAAAVVALGDVEHLHRTWELIRREKEFLLRGLQGIRGFKVYVPDANFFFIDIRESGFTAAELSQKLLMYGIMVRDCSSFTGLDPYYIRVAVKLHSENMKLLKVLGKVI